MQQVNMLHTIHQTTQQQLTQAQQMLHEMQHRYDRLLEAPRTAPPPRPAPDPQSRSTGPTETPRGEMRRCIVALLREHPEGLTPAEMRSLLGVYLQRLQFELLKNLYVLYDGAPQWSV
jgi:hypothetical protein